MSNIVIVDDTPANLNILSTMLNERGYTVRPAINGEVALTAIAEEAPNLILLDIMMPGMNGYEICQILKTQETTQHIPVIFISALDDIEDIVKAFEVGGVDYITKPFKQREVLARVESQLTLVNQRRELEERYQRDLEYYDTLNEMRDRFVHSATHDLKNPLNIVMGYTYLLKQIHCPDYDVKGEKYLDGILRGANQMQALVTDMLDLAKMGTGTHQVLQATELNPFLADCLQAFELPAQQKDIRLNFDPCDESLTLLIDQQRIGRVLDNLVSNAIKYTPPGGKVTVATRRQGDWMTIAIHDTGYGIPEADLPHIFDAFYRVERSEHLQAEGTGLGLSIVKSIIEKHGGRIEVDSRLGEGSVFRVYLR